MTAADLRDTRLALGWSQQRLADELHLTRGFVCDMERGIYAVDRRTELSVRYLLAEGPLGAEAV